MTSRLFALALCVLWTAAPAVAQSRGTKADPVSGTWTGELNVDGESRAVTLLLKFDGKGNVTGTFTGLPRPGDVKAGTFDTKTGALRLQLGVEGSPTVRLVLDGTLAKDKATGRVTGEATGEFTIA